MIDDLVHEIAHAAEKTFSMYIYENGMIEEEFLGKRNRLHSILDANNIDKLPPKEVFYTTEYSWVLDKFFFQEIGYPLLANLAMGLFVSPYGATSLSEYFSNGFEEYFIGDRRYLKDLSPVLYNIINEISDLY